MSSTFARADDSPSAVHGVGANLFDASEDCVMVIGLDGALAAMNLSGVRLMEIEDLSALRGHPWADLWPQADQPAIEATLVHARAGRVSRFTADCPTLKGTWKRWEVLVSPVFDEAGQPQRFVSISRDVTEQHEAETERALFTRELAHRIKNMFAVVDGVISLSARAAPESRGFADALRSRLFGLGRAIAYVSPPELMGRDANTDHTLHGLLHVLLAPYGDLEGLGRRVLISGDDTPVGRLATTSIALFANELATNALKYGSLASAEGRVEVDTRLTAAGLELVWSEHDGGGLAVDRIAPEGFGSALMVSAVTRQLGGTLAREWAPEGLKVRIVLPTEKLAR